MAQKTNKPVVTVSRPGLAPTLPNDATKYLDGTGAYSVPGGGSGPVTTTGSPASGNLTKFSGASSITNADLTGDVTTSGTVATTIANSAVTTAKINDGAVTEAKQTLADNTTNDVSTSKHGYAPKGDGSTTKFLNANGAYSTPSAAAGGAVSLIETQTPTGTTVTFSSLGSYTHLMILYSGRGDTSATSANIQLTFNNDSSSIYDREASEFQGTTVGATEAIAAAFGVIGQISAATAASGNAGGGKIMVFDYRGTTFHKVAVSEELHKLANSSGNVRLRQFGVSWRSTSAITSIELTLSAGNYVTGSVFSLYGIS